MPTDTPPTFASAAASNNNSDNTVNGRNSGMDWSRRTNGLQTFRRAPQINTSAPARDTASTGINTPNTGTYVPPHLNSAFQSSFSRNSASNAPKYSRDQVLESYKSIEDDQDGTLIQDLMRDRLAEDYRPGEGSMADSSWISRENLCPFALTDMTDNEREVFAGGVNSPLKAPTQGNKDGMSTTGLNGRKTSMNQGQGIPSGIRNDRPGPRRRETSDSIGSTLGTPGFSRRDESNTITPPSALFRRRTDFKEGSSFDKAPRLESSIDTSSSFTHSWKRTVSGPLSAGIPGPSSLWSNTGPQSAGFGNFGNFAHDAATPATPSDKRMGYNSLRGESRFKGLMNKQSSEEIGVKTFGRAAEQSLDKHLGLGTHVEERIGSAALLDDDVSSPILPGPEKKQLDDLGFSSVGTPAQLPTRASQDYVGLHDSDVSTSGTNPFASPELDNKRRSSGIDNDLGGIATFNARMQASRQPTSTFDSPNERADRSQNSSVGPQRNFPPISGLGNLAGLPGNSLWSNTTPGGFSQQRSSQPFGSSIFNSIGDVSSSGGPFGTPTSSAFPATARHRMGPLFSESSRIGSGDAGTTFPFIPTENSQSKTGRTALDDFFEPPMPSQQQNSSHARQGSGSSGRASSRITPEPNQPPLAQQKTIVMPDHIRWVYRDPSGAVQGPFTGLQMNEWHKAGFFSDNLQIKKIEDNEYESLGELIRLIGNGREPFLVPLPGISQGRPSSGPNQLGTPVQPPFGNNFPSFGTTLTADQQNALERRKQEEQVLMAQQKERLQQQQQHMMRHMNPGVPFPMQQPLHHQSSGHSLHSHPSFNNVAAPGGYSNQPSMLSQGGAFDRQMYGATGDNGFGHGSGLAGGLDRLNLGVSGVQQNAFVAGTQSQYANRQAVQDMLHDRALLHAQQDQWNSLQQDDDLPKSFERLAEFQRLRSGTNDLARPPSGPIARPRTQETTPEIQQQSFDAPGQVSKEAEQQESDFEDEVPQPSVSPLPAPAAQRSRQNVAEALAAESSRTQSPVETPGAASLAPWAKEAQSSKGPSLKEIQEAEAKKAAQMEEAASAQRRQLAQQERAAAFAEAAVMAQQQTAGLPSSANWAANSPSLTPGSAWSKAAVGKSGTPTGNAKAKTLAQIQKEEENRKQRAAAAAAAASVVAAPVTTPGGKSYANLAGKVVAPVNNNAASGGTWNVVGASGKAKAIPTPVDAVPVRSVSSGIISPVSKTKPQPVRSNTGINPNQAAADSFERWVKNSLSSGLNNSINVNDFVRSLMAYPLEEDLISDAIYGSSQILDGNRFAREFVQRKKEANKGKILDITSTNFVMSGGPIDAKGDSGRWNEVAKKTPTPAKEEPASTFKVVTKKKGKK